MIRLLAVLAALAGLTFPPIANAKEDPEGFINYVTRAGLDGSTPKLIYAALDLGHAACGHLAGVRDQLATTEALQGGAITRQRARTVVMGSAYYLCTENLELTPPLFEDRDYSPYSASAPGG
jgi:hypothetical protein